MMSEKIGWYHPVDESDQWDGFNDSGIEHFRGRPIMHLAREAIQNSLDAKENDYVLVKICLKKLKTASVPGIDELKKNIKLCYDIAENEGPIAKAFFQTAVDELNRKEINVLEISDYNTTGMVGPCNNGTKYYAFMKAKGQSRKDSETASGSYGIGKFAPYASSHIRTIFVSTIYENQTGGLKQLTQGKSILMSHDKDGQRRQGVGFWGICDKCRPVEGIKASLPSIIQKANRQEEMKKGTKLTILCFDASDHWKEILAVSVAENFFGAINNGELMVEIEDITLNKDTIMHFFNRTDIKNLLKSLQELPDEPNLFEVSRNYLEALQNNQEVIVEESERRELGLVQLRILIREGLPKRVCALRNGMFISDRLSGLKSFSDYKDFVAVVQCMSKKGNELLRKMEPPRHDAFEPGRLHSREEQLKGARALRDLTEWIREMLKRHAKEPVSSVTEIDELRDFFGYEGEEGTGGGIEDINPYGEILIRAKPLKIKYETTNIIVAETEVEIGGNEEEGGPTGRRRGGHGSGTSTSGSSVGEGGINPILHNPSVRLENVRAIITSANKRKLAFTPTVSGLIGISIMEAGADTDYKLFINEASKGRLENGYLILDVKAENRYNVDIAMSQGYFGAIKVIAHEI